jgi:hypothetical protein
MPFLIFSAGERRCRTPPMSAIHTASIINHYFLTAFPPPISYPLPTVALLQGGKYAVDTETEIQL